MIYSIHLLQNIQKEDPYVILCILLNDILIGARAKDNSVFVMLVEQNQLTVDQAVKHTLYLIDTSRYSAL